MKRIVKLPRSENRVKTLGVKLTLTEHKTLETYCKSHKVRKSDLVRYVLLKSIS